MKKELDIRPGDTVKVHQKIKFGKQDRIQAFEGLVLARKHGKGITSTITVRRVISGVGVEKTFPLHSPTIQKIEVVKRGKVKRAKLYYLRKAKGKRARVKTEEFGQVITPEESKKEMSQLEEKKEEFSEEVEKEKSK